MPQCCICNSGGECRNCFCAKGKRQCANCLPSRKGCCSNIAPNTTSPALVPVQGGQVDLAEWDENENERGNKSENEKGKFRQPVLMGIHFVHRIAVQTRDPVEVN